MVSTRGPKFKFSVGEKVLCYEPDPTKAKVLYDSKVMAIIEPKDKRSASKRLIEYLIHFQGWNSSWDRRVVEEFVLKDTDENRQLQKDLAEQSQLQIGAYLYRKEQKKRLRHMSGSSSTDKFIFRGSSDEGSSCSLTCGRSELQGEEQHTPINDDLSSPIYSAGTPLPQQSPTRSTMNNPSSAAHHSSHTTTNMAPDGADPDTESNSSSVESVTEEDRVFLQIGDILKTRLEYDWLMVTKNNRLVTVPADMPVITILENFVKHYSMKAIMCPSQLEAPRRRSTTAKTERREKDYDKLVKSINLRKEIADGLRIYFNFTLKEYLLYNQERAQANYFTSPEFTSSFKYVAPERQTLDMLRAEHSSAISYAPAHETPTDSQTSNGDPVQSNDEKTKRRLRSYKTEESEFIFDIALPSSSATTRGDNSKSSAVSNSSGSSTVHSHVTATSLNILRSILPLNVGITSRCKEILQDVLAWQTVPTGSATEPSMLYGAIHLARLIVKLPDFLNATSVQDDKLKTILKYLDHFIEFLESHAEWFGEPFYTDAKVPPTFELNNPQTPPPTLDAHSPRPQPIDPIELPVDKPTSLMDNPPVSAALSEQLEKTKMDA